MKLNKDGLVPGSVVSDEDFRRVERERKAKQPKEVKRRGRPKKTEEDRNAD